MILLTGWRLWALPTWGAQMRSALERGDETNVAENYHFGPRLAFGADAGAGSFGENIERTGKF